jgi:cephalosporin hydroxylase
MIDSILDRAYKLGMPQEKAEIEQLAKFVQTLQPKIVVEIGTKNEGTFMIWNEVTSAKTISIDLVEGIHGGVSQEKTNLRNENFKKLYGPRCTFIGGNSHDKSTYDKVLKCLNGEQIDFLFIDGDHTYEGVKQDYEMYSPLVKQGGYIAFHDINDTARHRRRNVYVGKLWNELKGSKIEFNANSDWAGIGIIKRITYV